VTLIERRRVCGMTSGADIHEGSSRSVRVDLLAIAAKALDNGQTDSPLRPRAPSLQSA
jgi:hypothetical protein